jgi:acetoin utilization protein AcuB
LTVDARSDRSTVGALMSPDPILVWPDTPVSEIADILDRAGISGVPVVDWSGYLVGVVSQTDLLRVRATEDLWADWSRLSAHHIMSRPVLTVTVDTPVEEAARLMESRHVHRLVVVADDGESPVGVLSATDLVRAMADRPVDP